MGLTCLGNGRFGELEIMPDNNEAGDPFKFLVPDFFRVLNFALTGMPSV
jgi:hypothetical protein